MQFVQSRLDDSALVYFWGVWCQKEAERGAFVSAISEIILLIPILEELSETDPEFLPRLGITAFMLMQIYNYNNQPDEADAVQTKYSEAIQAFQQG